MKREYLIQSFEQFGAPLDEKKANQFLQFAELLIQWNEKMNLTAITEFDEIVWKHFIDSLAILQSSHVSRETCKNSCIDVGTGAGFPGIPLKIMFPEMKLTLMDSLQKRINFLEEVIHVCHLEKTVTIHARAEDLAQDPNYREKYQFCVSRAVANLNTLSEYCVPFLKKGGIFVAYKAGNALEEIKGAQKAIRVFGGEIISTEEFVLRGSDLKRTLTTIKKVQFTPKKYPRKAGLPSKNPII